MALLHMEGQEQKDRDAARREGQDSGWGKPPPKHVLDRLPWEGGKPGNN